MRRCAVVDRFTSFEKQPARFPGEYAPNRGRDFRRFRVVVSGTGSAAPAFSSQNSPQTRARVVVRRTDVIYGRVQGSALLADLAFPEGDDVKPAILYVFGGRWRSGSRVNNQGNWERLAKLAESGFFTMTMGCRSSSGGRLAGARSVRGHVVRHSVAARARRGVTGVNENRIFLIGNSSGGHLVALAATLGDGPFARAGGWEKSRSDFRAAISVAAPYRFEHAFVEQFVDPGVGRCRGGPTPSVPHLPDRTEQPAASCHSLG